MFTDFEIKYENSAQLYLVQQNLSEIAESYQQHLLFPMMCHLEAQSFERLLSVTVATQA